MTRPLTAHQAAAWAGLRVELSLLRVGDTVYLPQGRPQLLVYDPEPVTLTRVVDCGNASLVLCWEGGERLYTASMQVGCPAVLVTLAPGSAIT